MNARTLTLGFVVLGCSARQREPLRAQPTQRAAPRAPVATAEETFIEDDDAAEDMPYLLARSYDQLREDVARLSGPEQIPAILGRAAEWERSRPLGASLRRSLHRALQARRGVFESAAAASATPEVWWRARVLWVELFPEDLTTVLDVPQRLRWVDEQLARYGATAPASRTREQAEVLSAALASLDDAARAPREATLQRLVAMRDGAWRDETEVRARDEERARQRAREYESGVQQMLAGDGLVVALGFREAHGQARERAIAHEVAAQRDAPVGSVRAYLHGYLLSRLRGVEAPARPPRGPQRIAVSVAAGLQCSPVREVQLALVAPVGVAAPRASATLTSCTLREDRRLRGYRTVRIAVSSVPGCTPRAPDDCIVFDNRSEPEYESTWSGEAVAELRIDVGGPPQPITLTAQARGRSSEEVLRRMELDLWASTPIRAAVSAAWLTRAQQLRASAPGGAQELLGAAALSDIELPGEASAWLNRSLLLLDNVELAPGLR